MAPITEDSSTLSRVRQIVLHTLHQTIGPSSLNDAASLYEMGMDSHASVNLMIALETQLGLEFPNRMLKRSVFDSVGSISAAVEELIGR